MAVNARTATLVDAIRVRPRAWVWNFLLILAGGTLMALFARIAIPLPFTPVPVTGQTLGVLLAGALLGARRGGLAMLVYLAEGLAGLPVFAGGASAWSPSGVGLPVILGPSAGYLFAYPLAAFAVGWLAERGWDRRFGRAVAAMVVGEVAIYAVGLLWLVRFVGAARVLPLGFLPFVPGDIVKLLLAAAVLPAAWRLVTPAAHQPPVGVPRV